MTKNEQKPVTRLKNWLRKYSKELPEINSEYPYSIRRAVEILNKHFHKKEYKIKKVMARCRIKNHNFYTNFKHIVDRTPKQYILYLRTEAAKKILENEAFEDISIGDISYALGFSPSAFSNCFKQRTGKTPTEWKEQAQNDG